MSILNKEVYESQSVQDTIDIAKKIAPKLKVGEITGLCGPMGAGKTHFVKGIAQYFQIDPATVLSPTFTLINEYHGDQLITHMDAFRMESDREFQLIDLDDYLQQDAIILVEWLDKFSHIIDKNTAFIEMEYLSEINRRIIFYPEGKA